MRVTQNEVIAEIKAVLDAQPSPEREGFTSTELMEAMGWGRDRTLRIIRGLINEGKVEAVWVMRQTMHGIMQKTKGYRLT